MSDALSDINKDERRKHLYDSLLQAMTAYLKDPTPENLSETVRLAKETDSVGKGFWGGSRTKLSKKIEDRLSRLLEGERDVWAKFLFSLVDPSDFMRMKKLSPFADKMIIAVDYGFGFVKFRGDVESLVARIIRGGKGWMTYTADSYVVVMDQPSVDTAEVFWVGCGILGQNGPRSVG